MRRSRIAAATALFLSILVTSWPTPSAAQTTDRSWVTLGDSYSSGEGIPGTNDVTLAKKHQGRDCQRATGNGTSATAWSPAAFETVGTTARISDHLLVACTGAVTDEIASQLGEAQDRLGRNDFDLVTFSIGGNDIGFADILKACLDVNGWGFFDLSPGCDIEEDTVRDRIDQLRADLQGIYDIVAGRIVAGGDVVVVGYPHLVEKFDNWPEWRKQLGSCEGILAHDMGMIRSLTGYLNEQIGAAVREADARHEADGVRFHFLDISQDPYEYSDDRDARHGLCSDDPWLNAVTTSLSSGDFRVDRSFHPTQEGHTNTGRVLAKFIEENIRFDDAPIPPLTIDSLATAPVPGLCEHPAGTLVGGKLPGIDQSQGYVWLDLEQRLPLIDDIDGDGDIEAVAIADCSQGGVGWPNSLLLYGPGPTLLDEFNLYDYAPSDERLSDYSEDRSGVQTMSIEDGKVEVVWMAHRDGDYGAGPSLPLVVSLDVGDGSFEVNTITRHDESPLINRLIQAANNGDPPELAGLGLTDLDTERMIANSSNAGTITDYACYGPTDSVTYWWVDDQQPRTCELIYNNGLYVQVVLAMAYGPTIPTWEIVEIYPGGLFG